MSRQRKLQLAIVLFLFIGLLLTTTSAFSYWREVTVSNDVEIITIGEPIDLLVTDLNTDPNTSRLVPSGYALYVGDVESQTLTYQVGVSRDLLNTVNLLISKGTVLIGGDATYGHLIQLDIMGMGESATIDLFNDVVTITVVVTLLEPIDEAEAIEKGLDLSLVNVEDSVAAYNAIKGQTVSFELLFELANKE
jgi:hypothetical protein